MLKTVGCLVLGLLSACAAPHSPVPKKVTLEFAPEVVEWVSVAARSYALRGGCELVATPDGPAECSYGVFEPQAEVAAIYREMIRLREANGGRERRLPRMEDAGATRADLGAVVLTRHESLIDARVRGEDHPALHRVVAWLEACGGTVVR